MMKMNLALFACILATASAFVPPFGTISRVRPVSIRAKATELETQLDEIASKLRLKVFDVNTGVYGFESKDPSYGIENIHTEIHLDHNGWLGLELVEVAHSEMDHRGLVLVSKVDGNAKHETPIHVGDIIIGVFVGDSKFRESTTGMDYDDTVDVIKRAKVFALDQGYHGKLTLELNRLVKRAQVQVEVEDEHGEVTNIDALAGDNLRLLLLQHHADLYDERVHRLDQPTLTSKDFNCQGEGICGTCLVAVNEGMKHLNKVGPQESSMLTNRPSHWRAACKTVVGADNEEGTKLRIRLHPHSLSDFHFHP